MMRTLVSLLSTLLISSAAYAQESISAGKYQAILGDCVACHGADLSGGMGFPIPVGEIYATNITPDKTYGIGNYSLEDFIKVMRQGVTKEGSYLYPAMPYTAYAKMTDEDLSALYQYLMSEVPAQAVANKDVDIPWPLNMRWPLAIWNFLFHEASVFEPDPDKSPEWNRGAYLVQGATHCGTCHTPRGLFMQEKALTGEHEAFLAGAQLAGWYANDIRGQNYSSEEIATLLKTGRSQHQAVLGPMAEVISYSSQFFTDYDLTSIALYITELSNDKPQKAADLAKVSDQASGIYAMYCSTCHGREGQGTDTVIPALAGNSTVLASDPASLLNILIHGGSTAHTQTHIGYRMPGYGWTLDDQQLADLANMLRASWGNQGSNVRVEQVAKQR